MKKRDISLRSISSALSGLSLRKAFGEVAEGINMAETWCLYIIECRTGDLYVGIAKDVEKRIVLHNKGQACRYTKYRYPVRLIYVEKCENYNAARKREREVKKYSREKKLALSKISLTPQK